MGYSEGNIFKYGKEDSNLQLRFSIINKFLTKITDEKSFLVKDAEIFYFDESFSTLNHQLSGRKDAKISRSKDL